MIRVDEPSTPLKNVMPSIPSSLPSDFSWLRACDRPTALEVDAYTHIIAHAEGFPPASEARRLREEAELQLWIWRTENRQNTRHRRSAPRELSARV